MKRFASLALCAALALSLTSCSKRSSVQNASTEKASVPTKWIVGVSLLTKGHPFYRELESSMRETAAKNGVKLLVQSGEMDLATQTHQVEDFITQKVDAIVVCPVDSKSIAGAIQAANKAKIPVFTADIAAQGGDVVCHIASDNIAGGKLAGERMIKLLGGKGKVAIIDHPVVASVQDRTKGFKEALKGSQIQIVADQAGDGIRDKAMSVTENILEKNKDLNGIFAINDSTSLGCLAAVRAAGRKDVVIIGYDGDPEARKEILAGSELKADAVQYPREIGKTTIEAIVKHLNGEKLPKVMPVKVGMIDQESLKADSQKAE